MHNESHDVEFARRAPSLTRASSRGTRPVDRFAPALGMRYALPALRNLSRRPADEQNCITMRALRKTVSCRARV
jgi:hypothetical protein